MRFHLIDRIETICYAKYITAVKCISLADDVFNEHFPGYPLFPGSLILEGLAQLGGSFFEITMKEQGVSRKHAVLTIVRQFKLRRPAGPGDRLRYRAEMVTMQDDYGAVRVTATLDDEVCAEGELMFNFVTIPCARIRQSREELYGIVTKNMQIIADAGPV